MRDDGDATGSSVGRDDVLPYGPDFTPSTLGKVMGEDAVLTWLLERALTVETKADLLDAIAGGCLSHIEDVRNRRDMASHVVQGLRNYGLVEVGTGEEVSLSPAGDAILGSRSEERDIAFARHILANCGGYRLVETIQRIELSGRRPSMESLNEAFGRHPTEKSISSMRAWLARAGVMSRAGVYRVLDDGLAAVVGAGFSDLLGLDAGQLEFVLAARHLSIMENWPVLEAPDVRQLAEVRGNGVKIPSKALGSFVRRLEERGLIEIAAQSQGRGGARTAFRLTATGIALTDEQIRRILAQSQAGYALSELGSIGDALALLDSGTADERGRAAERLAVHLCLMLGLSVTGWRVRLPVEVDLTAERSVGFAYQRWHVQVKNTDTDLDADRVDRELGAAAGTGATHLLFIVPRASMTSAARAEAISKARFTPLHIYWLTANQLRVRDPAVMIQYLDDQLRVISREKRAEALRREGRG